jgi:choline dehydrogenase-like flavoprotein
MFLDFEKAAELTPHPDICVIGAGIAGLTLAWELRHSGLKIVVVEGGGLSDEARSQALYDTGVEFVGQANGGVSNGRFRVYGGSGTRWGGQLIPLADYEMAPRAAVIGSGWPIPPAALKPYFNRLDAMLGLKQTSFEADGFRAAGRKTPVIESDILSVRFSKWLPWRKRNIGRFFRPELEKNPEVTVLYHANAVELLCGGPDDTITGVRLRSYDGHEQILQARKFVVALGTIETVRLLLASRAHRPKGIGNRRDLLGRYFMDHVVLRAGYITTDRRKELLQAIRPFFIGDILHTPRFELPPRAQAEEACLCGYAQITFQAAPDSAFAKLRGMFHDYQKEGLRVLSKSPYWALLRETPDLLAGFLARTVLGLRPIPARSTPSVFLFSEQPPRNDSRLSLAGGQDALGMPKLKMNWRIGEEERKTMTVAGQRFEALLRQNQLGSVTWFEEDFDAAGARLARMEDQYHHLGGARMGASENEGVVDTNCRVFGTENLYLASGAVFPNSGCSNPTFTIMALALRLAEHLVRR